MTWKILGELRRVGMESWNGELDWHGGSKYGTKNCVNSQTHYLSMIFAIANILNSLDTSADLIVMLYKSRCYLISEQRERHGIV